MRAALLSLAFLALPSASVSAQSRPLALEDYYRGRKVETPRILPDGRWVAYAVSLPVEATNGDLVEVWLAPATDDGQPRLVPLSDVARTKEMEFFGAKGG